MEPKFCHKPVMLTEVLQALQPRSGGRYVDGTLGGASHASAILKASSPDGWLYGCDRDGDAVEAAREALAEFSGRCEVRQGNFAQLSEWVPRGSCDGALLDLGVSSPQLDRAERGFSFQQEGPLDMRMDPSRGRTAAEVVNDGSVEELTRILWEYGEERQSRRFARAIVEARRSRPFSTTGQLAGLIESLSPRRGKRTHPATRVFQALRIAVNDELGSLEAGLAGIWSLLKPGGRLAVITFHSLEDRIVKRFARELERDYVVAGDADVPALRKPRKPELRRVTRKAIRASEAEREDNPRSRSAQLRVMEKL